MRLKRPYVPLSVRLAVIERQIRSDINISSLVLSLAKDLKRESHRLAYLLHIKFGDEPLHLDHEPPLNLRHCEDGFYVPDANDPNYLVYRTYEDHRVKTYVRGDGAQLSDAAKRRKAIRAKKKADPNRRKTKWPSRKIPSRKFGQ